MNTSGMGHNSRSMCLFLYVWWWWLIVGLLPFHFGSCSWNEWVTIPILLKDIPRTARLAMTVYDIYGPGKAVPVGGTTVSLFGKRGLVTFINPLLEVINVDPPIAQLVERWTVEVMEIHRSLVRIRLGGLFFPPAFSDLCPLAAAFTGVFMT